MAKKRKDSLSFKQQRFVDAYKGNATEAARIAGYKGNTKTLGQVGDQNLKKVKIKQAISNRESPKRKKVIADREERQKLWTDILRKAMTIKGIVGKGDLARLVEIDPKFKDILKASELLGKSEADFTDNLNIGLDPQTLSLLLSVLPEEYATRFKEALVVIAKGRK